MEKETKQLDDYLLKVNEDSEVEDIKELANKAKEALGISPDDIEELTTRFLNIKSARTLQHKEMKELEERLYYKRLGRTAKDNRIRFLKFLLEDMVRGKTTAPKLSIGRIQYRFQEKAKSVILDETKKIPEEFVKVETTYKKKAITDYLKANGDQEWGRLTNNGEKILIISQIKAKFKK